MNGYTIDLFLHVSGAIGICTGIGLWLVDLAALRRTQRVEQVRALAWLMVVISLPMVASILLLGIGGFDMALKIWGLQTPWILVALVSLALLAPIGPFVMGLRMHAILDQARAEPEGLLPAKLAARTHDPILGTTTQTYATMLLGIIFLMTNKPPLATSILVMSVAVALGLLSGLPHWFAAARRVPGSSQSTKTDPFLKKTIWTRQW